MSNAAALEEDVIVLYEKLSIGNEPEANRRWKLLSSGELLFSSNRPPVPRGTEFNTEYRSLGHLPPEQVGALLDLARQSRFWSADPHCVDPNVEDGMRLRLTIRDGDRVGRLISDNCAETPIQPIADALTNAVR